MMLRIIQCFFASLTFGLLPTSTGMAQDNRQADVIYGRKYGLALTMDVFKPTIKSNRAAIVMIVSGGWFSNPRGN